MQLLELYGGELRQLRYFLSWVICHAVICEVIHTAIADNNQTSSYQLAISYVQ